MLKFSMQMMGYRERSKFATKNSNNSSSSRKIEIFGVREREGRKKYLERGPGGPRRLVGAARGHAAPGGPLDRGWPPWLAPGSPASLFRWKFYFKFSGTFLTTSLLKKIRNTESCKTFGKLETVVKHMKFQKHKTLVQQGGRKIKEMKI